MRVRGTAAVLVAVVALGAGCGADDEGTPIPSDQAGALEAQLNGVAARIANGTPGACRDVIEGDDTNRTPIENTLAALPDGVDADVREALQGSFDRLFELVEQRCAELEEDETETTETPTETTIEPEETETQTTPTVPPPTETVTVPTVPPTPTVPDQGGSDGDSGGFDAPEGDG